MNENINEDQAEKILDIIKPHNATGVITAYNKKTRLVSLCFYVAQENPVHIAISLDLCSQVQKELADLSQAPELKQDGAI